MYDKKKVVKYIVLGMSKVPDLNTLKLPLIRTHTNVGNPKS